MLAVLFSDEYLTIVNKPCGMLVHRTAMAEDNDPVVLQLLREQTGRMVYPVHRLDRPTSGVLVFAHSPETAKYLQSEFTQTAEHKQYTALARGWIHEPVTWTREVKNDRGNLKEAETRFVPVERFELPYPTDRYPSARYTLVDVFPVTGRWHQIRQHLAQMRHYIVNDRVHGDGKQNHIFTEHFQIREMFLHACKFTFTHPVSRQSIEINAPFPEHWKKMKMLAEKTKNSPK